MGFDIISSIITGVISPITNVVGGYLNKKQDVSLEKFKVDGTVDMKLVDGQVSLINAQRQLLEVGVKDRGTRYLQYLFGYPLGLYYAKIILWDKVLGLGSTDPLKGDISTYSLWIVGFLFLHASISDWSRKT